MSRIAALTVLALTLAGCAVGPDYRAPSALSAAGRKPFASTSPALDPSAPPERWWRLFDSPDLDALVAQALTANTDLRMAEANLRRTRAALSEARAARLPTTSLSGSATYGRASAVAFGGASGGGGVALGGGSRDYESYALGLDVGYEVDLFGRVTRAIQAARADYGAQEAARDSVRVTVAAETARAYAEACSAAQQLAVARQSLALQTRTLDLTRRILADGRGTPLDVARSAALAAQTRSVLPSLETERRSALFRLAVLTGAPPEQVSPVADRCTVPPRVGRPLPVGDGAALIRRRPDVRQAERQLAGATARVGVAVADLYPSISLGGSAGWSAARIGDLGSAKAFQYSLGPLITWSFPNLVAQRARVRQARASGEAALATFDGSVLVALRETETALTAYANELDRNAALAAARDQSREAVRIVEIRYRYGKENFLAVLDAERTLAQADSALAASEGSLVDDQVVVFKSLGGGWSS